MNIDDQLYDIVAKEIRAESLVEGLYTRAFAEADGDKDKAKARYIKLRVQQLRQEYDIRVKQAKAEHDSSIRVERVKQAEERKNDLEKMYGDWDESSGEPVVKDDLMTVFIVVGAFAMICVIAIWIAEHL
jgi:bisphosphoglycerate-dependent phosphoglycerate mutase